MKEKLSILPVAPLSLFLTGALAFPTVCAQDAGARRGAKVPFVTFEAEAPANRTSGRVVAMQELPAAQTATPELEASGRSFVELAASGQYLEIPGVPGANGLVLRHCIPDAPQGGGMEATLSVYVNGKFRQKITLRSKYNWLYGPDANQNGQSNDPAAGAPHVFWDDSRFLIEGGLKRGDTFRLQKDESDTAEFYRIDLVDLEAVPPPLPPPKAGGYLSVADFGANGGDAADDTEAIARCIAEAKASGKSVWIPAGTYRQSGKFLADGVSVQGAGMWHTNLIGTVSGTNFAGNLGFVLGGDGAKVSDLAISSEADTRRAPGLSKPFTARRPVTNWTVENVWITHTGVGFWMSGAERGSVRGCRLYLTYADGININRGSVGNLVENNYVRGSGDDGLALLSERDHGGVSNPVSRANTLRHNTVIATWWGQNCSVGGGEGHIVEDNYFADNSRLACLTITLNSSYPMHPLTGVTIQRNTLVRGGGNHGGQRFGAIWIHAGYEAIRNAVFRENEILQPIFRGIHLQGPKAQEVVFEKNLIDRPGQDAVFIAADTAGSASFVDNVVRGLNPGFKAFDNRAGVGCQIILEGNSWQAE